MKRITIFLILSIFSGLLFAQETEKKPYKLIVGARVNPLVIYDFDGNRTEAVRLHGEIGMMWNKSWYFSAGYTPFMNSLYTFNEYWFVGMDKKVPVSFVASAEYMADNNKFILQGGPNVKLKGGNLFAFLFTPADNINWGLKVGAFIPLNVILKERK
ncbi:hypothetical protein [Marinilabilia sp.]|jgi:hypothetical protein|uniref:hypothetical protein n=1 Tax=Marinilabilia sp. TaxID=2021252 RepID=UPI0025B90774|nr:hypothetical protein [Marinilabilia sp.]